MGITATNLILILIVSQQEGNRGEPAAAVFNEQVEGISLSIVVLQNPLEGCLKRETITISIGVAIGKIRSERADRRAEHRLNPGHLDITIGLEVGPQRYIVAKPPAVEPADDPVIAVHRAMRAKRRLDPGIEPEFIQSLGQLGLIEKDIEPQHFGASGIVEHVKADVVAALGEREVAQVVVARRQLQAANLLAVDDHFNCRRPI